MGLDSMVIDTPTMTIGIRGTKVVANAAAEGETTEVVLLPEDDGTIGKNHDQHGGGAGTAGAALRFNDGHQPLSSRLPPRPS